MLKQWWASQNAIPCASPQLLSLTYPNLKNHPRFDIVSFPKKPVRFICVLKVGLEDLGDIIHNKVLIAAGVSAAMGQLSKPFTSVVLYGKDLDFRSIFQAGGFPSTHSSSVVAAATALALERGFADAVFGVTVIYAALIMYDAQGVRREVGNHARVLNRLPTNAQVSFRGEKRSLKSRTVTLSKEVQPLVEKTGGIKEGYQREEIEKYEMAPPLKESIGHNEVEVIAGGLFGFFVSLVVYSLL